MNKKWRSSTLKWTKPTSKSKKSLVCYQKRKPKQRGINRRKLKKTELYSWSESILTYRFLNSTTRWTSTWKIQSIRFLNSTMRWTSTWKNQSILRYKTTAAAVNRTQSFQLRLLPSCWFWISSPPDLAPWLQLTTTQRDAIVPQLPALSSRWCWVSWS